MDQQYGTAPALDEITRLQSSLRGQLLRPGDAGYDDARKVYNAMIDKRPGLIARCAGAADVISAVNFARTHKLLVAVRGAGHNVAGTSTCDGGILIDLWSVPASARELLARDGSSESVWRSVGTGSSRIARRRPRICSSVIVLRLVEPKAGKTPSLPLLALD